MVLCFANPTQSIEKLLRAHEVFADGGLCQCFRTSADAKAWCEAQLLRDQGQSPPDQCSPLSSPLAARAGASSSSPDRRRVRQNLLKFSESVPVSRVESSWVDTVSRFFEESVSVPAGETICRQHERAERIWLVQSGCIELYGGPEVINSTGQAGSADVHTSQCKQRILRVLSGSMFGEIDFFLRRRRSYHAVALEDSRVCALTVLQYDSLLREQPRCAAAFQGAVLAKLLENHEYQLLKAA